MKLYKVEYEHGFCADNGYRQSSECFIQAGDPEDCEGIFLALMARAGLEVYEDEYEIAEIPFTINEDVGI